MTAPERNTRFRLTAVVGSSAVVTVTMTMTAQMTTWVRCVCGHKIMSIPRAVEVVVHVLQSGIGTRGRVVECRKCRRLCEVTESP